MSGEALTMTTMVAELPGRVQTLVQGVRLVRLGPGEQGWIQEFEQILRIAAEDFLRRSDTPGTPDGVLQELAASLDVPTRAVWLALTAEYRLLGFALAECMQFCGGPIEVVALAVYLYPRRCPRAVFPALVRAILDWGASLGAEHGVFRTRRQRAFAWGKLGATPEAIWYRMPIAPTEVAP
jgi:hypothetical protein